MVQEDCGARPRLITLLALSRVTLQKLPPLSVYIHLFDGWWMYTSQEKGWDRVADYC